MLTADLAPITPGAEPVTGAQHDGECIDTAAVPGGGTLRLMRFGSSFSIQLGEDELMGSDACQSEEALADLAIERMGEQHDRILIGGLGMGFTLKAALAALPASSSVVVAELVPQVVRWARAELAHLYGAALDDPRLTLDIRDVHDVIAEADGQFDAILLDVDNGPDGFIRPANDRLYCNWGLRDARRALRPGGILAVWSAYPDDAFRDRLEAAGFGVEEVELADELGADRAPYTIWLATRPLTAE
ncbi:spermidine synthase [Sphingomonas sp. Y38-1Y]|uniref:spermidine synthase n=1 Tax=Sphingomonas sp. Y38-1Y TaxID=3078265 RepID=UPI0028E38B1E|nr:spermidine synthase [Sphingomonas sp. Y38-1Y]